MQDFTKIVRTGLAKPEWTRRGYSVFCKIEFKEGRLSVIGVEGPLPSGNARGGCGQIDMSPWFIKTYAPGWSAEKEKQFRAVWKRWHLNDMKAGTPKQEEYLKDHPIENTADHYTRACEVLREAGLNPDNGYTYGSKWLREEVPEEVLEFLQSLPDTDIIPAWV